MKATDAELEAMVYWILARSQCGFDWACDICNPERKHPGLGFAALKEGFRCGYHVAEVLANPGLPIPQAPTTAAGGKGE